MTLPTDKQLIATARKYGLDLNGLKCKVFALFDLGYSPKEVRYILRRYRNPDSPITLSNTVRRYFHQWKKETGVISRL